MLRYFPFSSDIYAMSMGLRPLDGRPLIEFDPVRYDAEIALKDALLAAENQVYARALPGSELAQWEVLELVLTELATQLPASCALERNGDSWRWWNGRRGETVSFRFGDPSTLPALPIDWAGRQVQEDLLLLDAQQPGFPLVAGQLCFANMWSLEDKLACSFAAIHEPVPQFATQLGRSSDLLMQRLKVERPVWRLNWSLVSNDWLNLAPRFTAQNNQSKQQVTAVNAGERCFLRVERQGLARLPRSNAILFSIHTYLSPIAEEMRDPQRARLLRGVLRTVPPDMLAYKGMTPFMPALLRYLEHTEKQDFAS